MNPDNGKVDGMGAIPRPDGVAFRVWAPNARQVALVGTFNAWDSSRHVMEHEGNGCWYAKVPEAAAGHEYRYLLTTSAGNIWRMDPYARQVTDSNGNAVVPDPVFDWEGDRFRMPPWNELVVYEMHLGTFHARHGGDQVGTFATAAARLKYLAELGINAIELMPIAEFEGSRSWGYNPAHLFAVETTYGGSRAFKAFVKECHAHGIAVILDVVYNHLGPNHLDLWRFDGWSNNGLGGIYFYNDGRARTPWGHTRPDYGRPEVRRFLRDNALMWLDEYHVDGLRCDATNYIRAVSEAGGQDIPEGWLFLQELNREVRQRYAGRITIAEDLQHNWRLTQDTGHGGAGFGSQWDAAFLCALRAAAVASYDECRPLRRVKEVLGARYNHDAFQRVIYTESHDDVACGSGKNRLTHDISPGDPTGWHSQKRSTLAAAVLLTAPGIPMLFQGQEFLESRSFSDAVPLDWGRCERHRGLVHLHRDLIALRLNRAGVTRGLCGQHVNVHHLNEGGQVVAYHRWDRSGPRDDVIVVANFSHRAYHNYVVGLPRGGPWRLRFNSDWRGYSSLFGGTLSGDCHAGGGWYDQLPFHAALTIGPYSVLVFSQDG
ncbi:MAG TPA: alpha-amylase family glycosyl hydrolase [Gemmataceae bacterium]|nr:alpha-amylase family glycosyl hydrolase [Gemmataceae bacterium]